MAANEVYIGEKFIIERSNAAIKSANQSTNRTLTVFVSSTIGDLGDYRNQVQDVLLRKAQVVCFLSEDWINEHGPTLQKCRDELTKAQGYIGIFGYWYGTVLPGHKQSITHLEYKWALEKLRRENFPIAIFRPKSASQAERKLKDKAALLIPTGKAKKKQHDIRLRAFREEVEKKGWMITPFKNLNDLLQSVIVTGMLWKKLGPLEAATGAVQVSERQTTSRTVTDEEWGLLGRADHLAVFGRILSRVDLYPDVPAVAMLVHGDEDSGQRVFLFQLLASKKLRNARAPRKAWGRPQLEQYDVKALVQWVGDVLGVFPKGRESGSIEELAELIHQELLQQQLVFVLDQVWRLSGGLTTWYEKFWQPLFARLAELRLQNKQQNQHRLVAIVVDYEDQSAFDDDKSSKQSESVTADDYARLWLLPVLRDISPGDLADWFDELDIQDDATGRRATLASLALKNAKGEIDGTPSRVFERLKQSSLWINGEE